MTYHESGRKQWVEPKVGPNATKRNLAQVDNDRDTNLSGGFWACVGIVVFFAAMLLAVVLWRFA